MLSQFVHWERRYFRQVSDFLAKLKKQTSEDHSIELKLDNKIVEILFFFRNFKIFICRSSNYRLSWSASLDIE